MPPNGGHDRPERGRTAGWEWGGLCVTATPRLAYPLDREDEHVKAAREAEARVYDHYGVDADEHLVDVPALRTRLRVVEVGSGPPVVLIPGGLGHGVVWAPLLPELEGHTVYVVDRPGGGLSDGIEYRDRPLQEAAVATMEAVVDGLDLETAPLVGNSMGGLFALRFALARPDRVSALGLLGCPAVYPGTSAPLPMRLLSVPGLARWLMEPLMQPSTVEDAGGLGFLGHPPSTADRLPRAVAEANYHLNNRPDYTRTFSGLISRALRPWGPHPRAGFSPSDLRAVDVPVVLLWGSDDPFGSVEAGRTGAAHLPDATFHEFGFGHLPWLDAPEECGDLLSEWLPPG